MAGATANTTVDRQQPPCSAAERRTPGRRCQTPDTAVDWRMAGGDSRTLPPTCGWPASDAEHCRRPAATGVLCRRKADARSPAWNTGQPDTAIDRLMIGDNRQTLAVDRVMAGVERRTLPSTGG
jgi:hypothetical protein